MIMEFQPFIPPSAKGSPRLPHETAKIAKHNIIRDNFTITTWLALGALLQCLAAFIAPQVYAAVPTVFLLSYRFLRTILMHYGVVQNSQMNGVHIGKFTAQIPSRHGAASGQVSDKDVTVIILASRSNHPLGLFGPGSREIARYFNDIVAQLTENADQYGFLGHTFWVSANERATSNQSMAVCYFRSLEDLHAYAHGPLHREAWAWWNKITKSHPHLSITHEIYQAPKNNWDNIFINSHLTGIASIHPMVKIKDQWARPLVDASRGSLHSMMGRMNRQNEADNEVYLPSHNLKVIY